MSDLFENLQLLREEEENGQLSFDDITQVDKTEEGKKILEQIKEKGNDINTYFEFLVPSTGLAETKAGELVRAIMRLLYRDQNDGDKFYEGYGLESSCAPAAAYLIKNGFEDLETFAKEQQEDYNEDKLDKEYTQLLYNVAHQVIYRIDNNPSLLVDKNTEDMLDSDIKFLKEYEKLYEYSIDIPYGIQEHINVGNITIEQLAEEISMWENCKNIENEWGSLTIKDLTKDEYELLDSYFSKWMEEYADQLNNEFGDPNESYSEE